MGNDRQGLPAGNLNAFLELLGLCWHVCCNSFSMTTCNFMTCASSQLSVATIAPLPEEILQRAFASFTDAASSLETSYRQLQSEVCRLRGELTKANLELEQAQEALHRKQALAEMAAMLAHEIRNPLGSMELLVALLADSSIDPQGVEWIEQLRTGVRMLSATVNNVLQFHSPSRPELLPVDLGEILTAAERFLLPLARQSGVAMKVEQELHGAKIAADRHCLQQVLFNLALNAFRAMPQGGTLQIRGRLSSEKYFALLEVADNGCGIPAEDMTRIFDSGFTTRKGNPGIGLTVCREIIRQHNGVLRVSSIPGRGTTFALQFPLVEVHSLVEVLS
jgi:signal transduction histidine kinase